MIVRNITLEGAQHVIANMRPMDREEIFATMNPEAGDDYLLMRIDRLEGPCWMACTDDGEPVALYGCAFLWEGVGSMWFFATKKITEIGFPVTKHIVRSIIPALWKAGFHRLECRSMEGHVDAQRWLKTLGAKHEGVLRRYGRDKQDFHCFTWENG